MNPGYTQAPWAHSAHAFWRSCSAHARRLLQCAPTRWCVVGCSCFMCPWRDLESAVLSREWRGALLYICLFSNKACISWLPMSVVCRNALRQSQLYSHVITMMMTVMMMVLLKCLDVPTWGDWPGIFTGFSDTALTCRLQLALVRRHKCPAISCHHGSQSALSLATHHIAGAIAQLSPVQLLPWHG